MNDIGMIGLAVMGSNLALNMADKGFSVSVWNLEPEMTRAFVSGAAKGNENIHPCYSLEELVASLRRPRRLFMMIRAGKPVDEMIGRLLPLLEEGDILIDGGNSHFPDTVRRVKTVEEKGMYFIGTGVSGGEEGALHGPCMMPGGSEKAWEAVAPIFRAICAKADGMPCVDWIGRDGAGHFVKMVHNGIEYGDMQLICESYHLMRTGLGMKAGEMAEVFGQWNKTELESYLISITADILARKEADGTPTVDLILDRAGQKGTGKWTSTEALDEGVPLTAITEAVFARCLSADKDGREKMASLYPHPAPAVPEDREAFLGDLRRALYAGKLISYAQGYALLKEASGEYGWDLPLGTIALLWRGGCIIRSAFLRRIAEAYAENPALPSLLAAPYFRETLTDALPALRRVAAYAAANGIPMPALTSALSWLDGFTSASLPANLLQGMRDYFGAHTYERIDAPRGTFFHTDWTGHGDGAASTTYNV